MHSLSTWMVKSTYGGTGTVSSRLPLSVRNRSLQSENVLVNMLIVSVSSLTARKHSVLRLVGSSSLFSGYVSEKKSFTISSMTFLHSVLNVSWFVSAWRSLASVSWMRKVFRLCSRP